MKLVLVNYKEYMNYIRTLFEVTVSFGTQSNEKIENISLNGEIVAQTRNIDNKYQYFIKEN